MQFSCGQCGTRYAVPDDKVRGKRIRTKCRKCGAEIVVDGVNLSGDAPPPSLPPVPAPGGPAPRPTPHAGTRVDDPWTVAISRSDQRKMVTAEIVEAYAAGTITDTTLVWKPGMEKWQPPFDIPAIALALLARGLEPSAKSPDEKAKPESAVPAASAASDWDDEATRVFDASVVAADMPAPPRVPSLPPAPAPPKVDPRAAAMARAAASAPPKVDPRAAGIVSPKATNGGAPASAGWDDEDEATKMFAPDRALLGRRLPKSQGAQKSTVEEPKAKAPVQPRAKLAAPGTLKSRPPPVPPRRSVTPARTSKAPAMNIPPPARPPSAGPPVPAEAISEDAREKSATPTVRPPPGAATEDPFGFEDEATAVITADRAKALLEEQLTAETKQPDETPMSFGTSVEPPQVTAKGEPESAGGGRAKRESLRSSDDLVEKGPTVVVAESARTSSVPPPPVAPPKSRPGARDFGGIQHERTRVIRAVKKPTGPLFWVGLVLALLAAAVGGYYASRLLDGTGTSAPEQR